ncbi:hypothetical protein LZ24_01414 [Desulfobotulus alkaliphilus]|uniref:Uncharacterized protein n=1 Tax=Desulfobotulus alkaliphilus TaxID=622671 RepID=A0A562RW02_9BACT|nr:hypothetical protein LZ24_01414 [Desulfobotulus alkaliphilus]
MLAEVPRCINATVPYTAKEKPLPNGNGFGWIQGGGARILPELMEDLFLCFFNENIQFSILLHFLDDRIHTGYEVSVLFMEVMKKIQHRKGFFSRNDIFRTQLKRLVFYFQFQNFFCVFIHDLGPYLVRQREGFIDSEGMAQFNKGVGTGKKYLV